MSKGQRYLLDSDTLSDLIRNPQGPVAARIAMVGEARVCTSIIVASELRFGASLKRSLRLARQLESVLGIIDVCALDTPADRFYADLRTTLQRSGTPIGPNDLWIAAHALAFGMTLVTGNIRELARVPRLKLENWMTTGRR